jgi:glycosyltransferase involved in cell wall biosynthesis
MCRDYFTALATHILTTTRTPVVAQTHGMLGPPPSSALFAYDLVVTQPLIRSIGSFFYLGEQEKADLIAVGVPEKRLRQLDNASAQPPYRWVDPTSPLFVFASRLHKRKQPLVFVEAAIQVLARGLEASFVIVGPDQGEEAVVRARISKSGVEDRVHVVGGMVHDDLMRLLSRSTAMVFPSLNEPYGMIVVEALSMGVPTIATTQTGIGQKLRSADAAILAEPTSYDTAQAICKIAGDVGLRRGLSVRGLLLYASTWQPQILVENLEEYYMESIGSYPTLRPGHHA